MKVKWNVMSTEEMLEEVIEYEVSLGTYKNIDIRIEFDALEYQPKFVKWLYNDMKKNIRKNKLKKLNEVGYN